MQEISDISPDEENMTVMMKVLPDGPVFDTVE